jgi:hypothetical protein
MRAVVARRIVLPLTFVRPLPSRGFASDLLVAVGLAVRVHRFRPGLNYPAGIVAATILALEMLGKLSVACLDAARQWMAPAAHDSVSDVEPRRSSRASREVPLRRVSTGLLSNDANSPRRLRSRFIAISLPVNDPVRLGVPPSAGARKAAGYEPDGPFDMVSGRKSPARKKLESLDFRPPNGLDRPLC